MSEFQYYEFLAIDNPLSSKDQLWLRGLSSRARITTTRFTNTYTWGDFKGDPVALMERCFDAHVYTSNFGVRHFMLKLPPATMNRRAADVYVGDYGLTVRSAPSGLILTFDIEGDPEDLDDEEDDETGWMAALLPLRAELIDGDSRSLYLAWLLNVQSEAVDDDVVEPPVPPGLAKLSPACRALADFLVLDECLLDAAAERSGAPSSVGLTEGDWHGYVTGLRATERDALLVRLLQRDDPAARRAAAQALRRQRTARDGGKAAAAAPASRTVGELVQSWRARQAAERQRDAAATAKAQARAAAAAERARAEHLADVARRGEAAWRDVEQLIAQRNARKYDEAVALLVDLRDLAQRDRTTAAFARRLRDLRAQHASKPRLIERFDGAGLP